MMFYDNDILNMGEDMTNYWFDDTIQNCSKILNETETKQQTNKQTHVINKTKNPHNIRSKNKYSNHNKNNSNHNKYKDKDNKKTILNINRRKKDKKLNYI